MKEVQNIVNKLIIGISHGKTWPKKIYPLLLIIFTNKTHSLLPILVILKELSLYFLL